jgi:hypothetical protein
LRTRFAIEKLALASEEARSTPFPQGFAKTPFCSLLLPCQNQSAGFDFERKTEGTDMELSRLFTTGKAKCSEFRLTTARGLAKLGLVCVFEAAKLPQKRFEIPSGATAIT